MEHTPPAEDLPKPHLLIVACAGDCDREPDEPNVCTCTVYSYRFVCPVEDGHTVIACGNWETCGCSAVPYGPRAQDGSLSSIITAKGFEFDEDDWMESWALDIQPICPTSWLEHHQWESTLFTSTPECFGRLNAEHNDKGSFAGLPINTPGEYPIGWTVEDGLAYWKLLDAQEPVSA